MGKETRFTFNDLTTGGEAAGGNGYAAAANAVVGMLSGIFTAMGLAKPKDPQHIYSEAVVIPESKVDMGPFVFAGSAVAVLALSIYLLRKA